MNAPDPLHKNPLARPHCRRGSQSRAPVTGQHPDISLNRLSINKGTLSQVRQAPGPVTHPGCDRLRISRGNPGCPGPEVCVLLSRHRPGTVVPWPGARVALVVSKCMFRASLWESIACVRHGDRGVRKTDALPAHQKHRGRMVETKNSEDGNSYRGLGGDGVRWSV